MSPQDGLGALGAAWRTWGGRGLVRRARYEGARRSGWLERVERPPFGPDAALEPLAPVGIVAPRVASPPEATATALPPVLYGGVALATSVPPDWHLHPLTGHRYRDDVHWSALSDADPGNGDIKDVWEMSRFAWLQPRLRRWAGSGDEEAAEAVWQVIEDWHRRNPPYRGPHWMCGQETSLRAVVTMFLADALRPSPATTPARQRLVAQLVSDSVGRVAPTLGYALSQRNNHAISEAGFLWTAAALVPSLPDATRLGRRAGRALREAVADQFAPDGAYAQHSPTYHRLALHVLLWCMAVERATGTRLPGEVRAAVGRSVPHLRSLMAPGGGGRVPDLGGDDGALLFALAPGPIGDLRPVLAHAAAATDQPSGLGEGPWDEEAAWFGLAPTAGRAVAPRPSITTHALTRGRAHAVVRAGPLAHRPAHADQLHVDVWLDGAVVARDPGSYRYTAPAPWGNALAGEEVHNLPRRAGHPQAVRSGRFFWRRWTEADVLARSTTESCAALLTRIELGDVRVRRLVVVAADVVLVVDDADGGAVTTRWNLPRESERDVAPGRTALWTTSWRVEVRHGGTADILVPEPEDPATGWWAPTYGRREELTALEVGTDAHGRAAAAFGTGSGRGADLGDLARAGCALDLDGLDLAAVGALLGLAEDPS